MPIVYIVYHAHRIQVRLDLKPFSRPNVSCTAKGGMEATLVFEAVQSVVLANGTDVYTDTLRLGVSLIPCIVYVFVVLYI